MQRREERESTKIDSERKNISFHFISLTLKAEKSNYFHAFPVSDNGRGESEREERKERRNYF